jgi:hypothetical protein
MYSPVIHKYSECVCANFRTQVAMMFLYGGHIYCRQVKPTTDSLDTKLLFSFSYVES